MTHQCRAKRLTDMFSSTNVARPGVHTDKPGGSLTDSAAVATGNGPKLFYVRNRLVAWSGKLVDPPWPRPENQVPTG